MGATMKVLKSQRNQSLVGTKTINIPRTIQQS